MFVPQSNFAFELHTFGNSMNVFAVFSPQLEYLTIKLFVCACRSSEKPATHTKFRKKLTPKYVFKQKKTKNTVSGNLIRWFTADSTIDPSVVCSVFLRLFCFSSSSSSSLLHVPQPEKRTVVCVDHRGEKKKI